MNFCHGLSGSFSQLFRPISWFLSFLFSSLQPTTSLLSEPMRDPTNETSAQVSLKQAASPA